MARFRRKLPFLTQLLRGGSEPEANKHVAGTRRHDPPRPAPRPDGHPGWQTLLSNLQHAGGAPPARAPAAALAWAWARLLRPLRLPPPPPSPWRKHPALLQSPPPHLHRRSWHLLLWHAWLRAGARPWLLLLVVARSVGEPGAP